MRKNTCSNCTWFSEGLCFYNPPIVQIMMAQTPQGVSPQPLSVHPPVRATHFCAHHQLDGEPEYIEVLS